MRQPKGYQEHQCAPAGWRHTPNMTGDYDLDASIMHCSNPDMAGKIRNYLMTDRRPYQNTHRTAYTAYDPRSWD